MVALEESRDATAPLGSDQDCGRVPLAEFFVRHWAITILVLLGAGIRAFAMYAYWPAFWFAGDSGVYIGAAHHVVPGAAGANGVGYPAFLWLISHTGSLAAVAVAQHLLGLGLAVAIYRLLRKRGVTAWLATLGAAPILLDARQIVVEHFILSDTLFTVLLVAAVIMLLRRDDRPGVTTCVLAGTLLAAAVVTRSVGLAACALLPLYLLIRRVGWLRLTAFTVTVGVLLFGYLSWARYSTGTFSFSTMQGRFLYSRVAIVADCAKLELTTEQRELCPTQPLDRRPERGDWYVWNDPNLARFGMDQDALIGSFAKAVITQQPWDYLAMVTRDTARFLAPGIPNGPATSCLFQWWAFPAELPDTASNGERCKPLLANSNSFSAEPVNPVINEHSRLRKAFAVYSDWITVPRTALGIAVLLGLAAACWRPRRPGWRDGLDSAALTTIAVGLLVLAAATTMYEIRYALPSIVLLGMGGALGVHRLRAVIRKPHASAEENS
jgi:hypothetical protein